MGAMGWSSVMGGRGMGVEWCHGRQRHGGGEVAWEAWGGVVSWEVEAWGWSGVMGGRGMGVEWCHGRQSHTVVNMSLFRDF